MTTTTTERSTWRSRSLSWPAVVLLLQLVLPVRPEEHTAFNKNAQRFLHSASLRHRHEFLESLNVTSPPMIPPLAPLTEAASCNNIGSIATSYRGRHLMDAPPMIKPAQCSSAYCLVQALLDRNPKIIVMSNIVIAGSAPLPDITTPITILGTCIEGPCQIDAKGNGAIFVVGISGYLTLKDLEIRGGFCSEGAAVMVSGTGTNLVGSGGKLVALNVHFYNNTATELGGAISVHAGGMAFVQSSVFWANSAPRGGAVYIGSNEDYPVKEGCGLSSCTTFSNCAFVWNWADKGGAVYVDDASINCADADSGGGKLDVVTSRFQNNSAQVSGGAIFLGWRSVGGVSQITRSTFINNSAVLHGGDVTLESAMWVSRGVQMVAYESQFSGMTSTGTKDSGRHPAVNPIKPNPYPSYWACTHDHNGKPTECMVQASTSSTKASAFTDTPHHSRQSGEAVDVEPFANATFIRCQFPDMNSVKCQGAACNFCPSRTYHPSETFQESWRTGIQYSAATDPDDTCPNAPTTLCSWVPKECLPRFSPPPPPPSPPPPSPPPPSPPPPSPPPPSPPPPSPPPPHSPPPPSPPPPSPPPPKKHHHRSPPPPSPPPPPPPKKKFAPPPPGGAIESAPNAPPPPAVSSPPPPCSPPRQQNNGSSIVGDPHFFGKHGERFDFHGTSGRVYCIVADKDVHINMQVFKGTKKGTTFISEIGVLYKDSEVFINAQEDVNASRVDDQWKLEVNKVVLPIGNYNSLKDGLIIDHLSRGVLIQVPGEMVINITIVPATHGTRGSEANYINFKIDQLKVTPSVHGLLGQTYQETKRTYQKLHQARGKKGKKASAVLVDGSVADYVASDILAPDCKFASFEGHTTLAKRIHRVLFSTVQSVFAMNPGHEVVSACAGFGDSSADCNNFTF